MNNIASILILVFLAITFLQSSQDKLFHWKDNLIGLKNILQKHLYEIKCHWLYLMF